jgi:hypothetical protein
VPARFQSGLRGRESPRGSDPQLERTGAASSRFEPRSRLTWGLLQPRCREESPKTRKHGYRFRSHHRCQTGYRAVGFDRSSHRDCRDDGHIARCRSTSVRSSRPHRSQSIRRMALQRGGTCHRDEGTVPNRAASLSSTRAPPPNPGVQTHPHHPSQPAVPGHC